MWALSRYQSRWVKFLHPQNHHIGLPYNQHLYRHTVGIEYVSFRKRGLPKRSIFPTDAQDRTCVQIMTKQIANAMKLAFQTSVHDQSAPDRRWSVSVPSWQIFVEHFQNPPDLSDRTGKTVLLTSSNRIVGCHCQTERKIRLTPYLFIFFTGPMFKK